MLRIFILTIVCTLASGGVALAKPQVLPRKYATKHRIEVAPIMGYVSTDPWVNAFVPGASIAYHLDEKSAIEATFQYGIYADKSIVEQVEIQKGGQRPPVISRPTFFATANYGWKPIYGKFNLLGEIVIKYDLLLMAGGGLSLTEVETNGDAAGTTTLSNKIFPVIDVGIVQHLYITERLSLRLDFRPYVFIEFINDQVDPNADAQYVFGLSYLFGDERAEKKSQRKPLGKATKRPTKKSRKR